MDRATAFPLEETTELDILNTNKFAMIALSKLAVAMLGTGPYLHGLACAPGSGLTVQVGAGQVYQTAQIDATAYSSLGTDTHTILKQGIVLDPTVLSCPAPTTAGRSINYLIQVGYLDVDTGNTILPFYNASNPAIPYTGPGGSGGPVSTIRAGQCSITIKAGASAATGSQVTPSPDSGYTGAYVVQVDFGMTSIPSGNIATAIGAPFLTGLLNSHHHGTAGQAPKIDLTSEVQGILPLVNLPSVPTVVTPTIVGHIAVFNNVIGGITDGGPAGVAPAPTPINFSNSGITLGPGDYLVDTSAGAITVNLLSSITAGASWHFTDQKGTMDVHPLSLNAPAGVNFLSQGLTFTTLRWDVTPFEFLISYDGTNLGVS